MTNSSKRNGFFAIAVGVALLGTGPIFVKSVNANGLLVGFYRMFFAGLLLTIPALAEPAQADKKPGKTGWFWAIGGSLIYGINIALWCTALNFTTASAVTLLDTTAPVWVGLFGFLFLGKKYPALYWIGLAVTLAGAAMTVGLNSLGVGSVQIKGNLIALASGFTYAGYIIFTRKARAYFSAVKYSWLVGVIGAAALFVVVLFAGLLNEPLPLRSYLLIAAMALISQVIAWVLVNHALGVLPQSAGSAALVGQPIITTLLGALILHEYITWLQGLGGLICLAGILIVQMTARA
jgi:drug/metabolite transporter (DMT)-like permease